MQQNDSMLSGVMIVAATNVASTSSSIVAITNATPNQATNVATTHASTTLHGQMLQLLKYIKGARDGGKRLGMGSQSSKVHELKMVT
jgi:hypothetical protein